MRKIKSFKSSLPNSLLEWHHKKNPVIVAVNFLIIYLCKYLPCLSLKRFLLRLIGLKIEKNVAIGLGVSFDIFFPELITLKENCVIGFNATILCHEFLVKEFRLGGVVIGRNALIGANSTILPGVEVGENAIVSAMSLVNKDIKPNTFVGGIPAKEIKRI